MPSAPGAAMLGTKLFVTRTVEPWPDLFERWWDGEEWIWVNHGRSEGKKEVSAPGAAMMNEKLFVVVEDGALYERHWRADLGRWAWEDHGSPPGTGLGTAPGAAMLNSKLFVGTRNERLFERFWNGSAWVWVDHGTLLHDTRVHLVDNSAAGPKKTLAVVGDGFAEADLGRYKSWVRGEVADGIFGHDLFRDLRGAFNVIRIDLVSIDSGVSQRRYDERGTSSDPSDDVITSTTIRQTRLGFLYSGSWAHCWLERQDFTNSRLQKVLTRFAPNWDYVLVVLNEAGQGGCGGGGQQVVTLGENWATIAHEFGHGIGNLADEYFRGDKTFTGTEFNRPNCSVTAVREDLKWADKVAASTPLPTTSTPSGWNDNRDVGAFEGCGTFGKGLYRPVKECRMKSNRPPYCPVCEEVMRDILEPFL